MNNKTSKNSRIIAIAIISLVITFFVFRPVLKNEFVNWDDPSYVLKNKHFRDFSLSAVFQSYDVGNYHPFTIISLYIDYKIGLKNNEKINAYSFHLHNLILHLISVLFVFIFIYYLFNKKIIPAFFVAILFGVHPMHVESVAWVSERKDVLYTMYFFASLVCYMVFRQHKGKQIWYCLSVVFFLFSLFSKGQAVTLFLVIVLIDFYQKRKIDKAFFIEKVPFFLLSLLFGLIAIDAQKTGGGTEQVELALHDSLFVGFYGILLYIYKFFCPANLSVFYPYPFNEQGSLPSIMYCSPIIVAIIVIVLYFIFRKDAKAYFGPLFFLATIFPVLQFLPIGRQIIAERYTYIPYVGLSIMIVYIIQKLDNIPSLKKNVIPSYIVLSIFVVVLSIKTNNYTRVWKNSKTLWSNVIEKFDSVFEAWNNRAVYYMDNKKYNKAISDLNKALEIEPGYIDAYNNRGVALHHLGRYKKAIKEFNQAIKHDSTYAKAYINRSMAWGHLGELNKTIHDCNKAIALDSTLPDSYSNKGIALSMQGNLKEAIKNFNKAIELNPVSEKYYFNRGFALIKQGKKKVACSDFYKSKKLGKADADKAIDKYCK